MIRVTVHQAKTTLSKLIQHVLAGEEVVIARGATPVGASGAAGRRASPAKVRVVARQAHRVTQLLRAPSAR